jgi:hypothetical protein
MARILHIEKGTMQQVNQEVDSKIKKFEDTPKSVFNKEKIVEETIGKSALASSYNTPTLYPSHHF